MRQVSTNPSPAGHSDAGVEAAVLPPVTLILGGARSGKSAYGERLLEATAGDCLYLATAEAGDGEMAARIARHRARRGKRWQTLEEPLALAAALARLDAPGQAILIDCLTLWLANLMARDLDPEAETEALLDALARVQGGVVLVANEVGLGIVPEHPLGRRFRDAQGLLNQAVASLASRVVFIAAGLPLVLKDCQENS